MKRVFALTLTLLLAAGLAHGQGTDGFWTRNADLYYHAIENCGGAEEMVSISREAALAFAKYACPVCVQAEDAAEDALDVRAVSRGGVIVVKFSDVFLAEQEISEAALNSDTRAAGQAAWQQLGEYLHGENYVSFTQDYFAQGEAQGRAREPYIFAKDAQVMSSRHIGNDWYIVVRPEKRFKSSWNMLWKVNSVHLRMDADGLACGVDLQSREENRGLELKRLDGEQASFTGSIGDVDLRIYSALDGYVAVISDPDGAKQNMNCARLMIGGAPGMISLSGYADGAAAVYCCALSEGEVNALASNTRARLVYFDALANGYWGMDQGGDYAIYSDAAGEVVFCVDKLDGNVPVDADYRCLLWMNDGNERFVLWQETGAVICDYHGNRYAVRNENGDAAERVTPLCWKNGHGVFLAEIHKYQDYSPEDRLFAEGLEYGLRVGSADEDEWGSYRCWLADENGRMLTSSENRAFRVAESGDILLESFDGDEQFYKPFSD